jgi:hypothetical protein
MHLGSKVVSVGDDHLAPSQSIGKTSAHWVALIASMGLPWLAPSLWPFSANEHQSCAALLKVKA